jgi:hypothetical protein
METNAYGKLIRDRESTNPKSIIQNPKSIICLPLSRRSRKARRRTATALPPLSSFILHPSSFILHPSSFILHPSSFILHPSSFILHPSLPRLPVAEDATSEHLFSKHKPTNSKYEIKNHPPRSRHHPADPLFKHLRAGMRRRGRFPGPTQRESLRRRFHGE